jgi:hypothetical protein
MISLVLTSILMSIGTEARAIISKDATKEKRARNDKLGVVAFSTTQLPNAQLA